MRGERDASACGGTEVVPRLTTAMGSMGAPRGSRGLRRPRGGSRRPWARAGAAAGSGRTRAGGRGRGEASSWGRALHVVLQSDHQSSRAVQQAPSDMRLAYVEGFGGSRGVRARAQGWGWGAWKDGGRRHLVGGEDMCRAGEVACTLADTRGQQSGIASMQKFNTYEASDPWAVTGTSLSKVA